jgi:hypothetical protein
MVDTILSNISYLLAVALLKKAQKMSPIMKIKAISSSTVKLTGVVDISFPLEKAHFLSKLLSEP